MDCPVDSFSRALGIRTFGSKATLLFDRCPEVHIGNAFTMGMLPEQCGFSMKSFHRSTGVRLTTGHIATSKSIELDGDEFAARLWWDWGEFVTSLWRDCDELDNYANVYRQASCDVGSSEVSKHFSVRNPPYPGDLPMQKNCNWSQLIRSICL